MIDKPKAVQLIAPNERVVDVKPGDFYLVHKTSFIPRLIQFGQKLRYTKEEAKWNHCGVFTSTTGDIAEALVKTGVTRGNISKYDHIEYIVVNVEASDEDRQQMMKFVDWTVGKSYGMLTDISLSFWCILGGKFDFSLDGDIICSGLIARVLERAGYIFERDPQREMPADLAHHFLVHQTTVA